LTLYTYKEALETYGSRSALTAQISRGKLFNVARNLYSEDQYSDSLAQVMKLYPETVVTGLTAFYIYGLTDKVPVVIDLATRRNATRISNPEVKQHFVDNSRFDVGVISVRHDGTMVRIYDLEMMLFYLVRNDGKLPLDLFREVLKSYRKRTDELDFGKLQWYADLLPWGRKNLERIVKELL